MWQFVYDWSSIITVPLGFLPLSFQVFFRIVWVFFSTFILCRILKLMPVALGETAAVTIGSLLTDVTSVFTSAIGMVGKVATTITSNPLLLVLSIVPLCGIGVGFFKRLISVN